MRNRLARLASKIFFPEKARLMKTAFEEERIPLEEIRKHQLARLKSIINHAYEHVDFYKKKFDKAGVKPEDIQTLSDIKKIPVTTKEELNENYPVKANNIEEWRFIKNKTSGSSGTPLVFFIDKKYESEERKSHFRLRNAAGISSGMKILRLRNGNIRGVGFKGWILKTFGNTIHLSTKNMEQKNMQFYVDKIKEIKPEMIETFPHHINTIANYMKKTQQTLKVPIIYIVGGNLASDERKTVTDVFTADHIFNNYGAAECMNVMYQCKKGNYHLEEHRFITEILVKGKDAKKGEIGEILLTNLYNETMPLIRYRIRDLAVAGNKCTCGRTYPIVTEIKGRIQQAIFLPNGKILDANQIRKEIQEKSEEVKRFQVKYTQKNELIINIKPMKKLKEETKEVLISKIQNIVGTNIKVTLKTVKDIPFYGEEQKSMDILTEIPPDLTKVI